MIAVIADDFSGAAEIAGIAAEFGLAAEVQTEFDPTSSADVIAIDADTRSRPPAEAAGRIAQLTRLLDLVQPDWIYRKVDSVLRGPVAAELGAMLAAGQWRRAVLVPANPSRGRVVRGGHYLVEGVPLDRTAFATDPEYPRSTANVLDLLRREQIEIRSVAIGGSLPPEGVAVCDAETACDVIHWVNAIGDETLPAGAADFFRALLSARSRCRAWNPITEEVEAVLDKRRSLLVCGSAIAWEERQREAESRGIKALSLPLTIDEPSVAETVWAMSVAVTLNATGAALVGIGLNPRRLRPEELTGRLCEVVARLLENCPVDTLLVEGGATAAALARQLEWKRLTLIEAVAPGVTALSPFTCNGAHRLLVKPGSYRWPTRVWPTGPREQNVKEVELK